MCPIWNVDQPPLSVAYIAGKLKSAGHEVFCHDFSMDLIYNLPVRDRDVVVQKYLASGWYTNFEYWRDKLSIDPLVGKWTDEVLSNTPGVVGFSIYDSTLSVSLLLAAAIRKKSPETLIVFGGPSCDNKDIITRGPIDFLVYGEGEDTITDLIERLENNISPEDCPGIVYAKEGHIFQTEPRPRIADIDAIPFPDFSGFDLKQYPSRSLPMFPAGAVPTMFFLL